MPIKSCVLWGLLAAMGLQAETGHDAWLRYSALGENAQRQYRNALPAVVATLDDSVLAGSARAELVRGVRGMVGRTLRIETGVPRENAILLGTLARFKQWSLNANLSADGYWL